MDRIMQVEFGLKVSLISWNVDIYRNVRQIPLTQVISEEWILITSIYSTILKRGSGVWQEKVLPQYYVTVLWQNILKFALMQEKLIITRLKSLSVYIGCTYFDIFYSKATLLCPLHGQKTCPQQALTIMEWATTKF